MVRHDLLHLAELRRPTGDDFGNEVSRTGGTSGGWLRGKVGCQMQLQINGIEPLIKFMPNLSQMSDLLKTKFLVQPNARGLIRGDVRQQGARA